MHAIIFPSAPFCPLLFRYAVVNALCILVVMSLSQNASRACGFVYKTVG